MLRYTALLVWTLLFAQAQVPTGAVPREDVYAIYSALLSSPDELILIQSETTPYVSPTVGCVRAPQSETADLLEIQADYEARKHAIPKLVRDFRLDKPYLILDIAEVRSFLQDALHSTPQILPRGGVPPPNPNPHFPQARRVFRFGDVYFNKSRTIAAVYYSIDETSYDFTRGWAIVRKSSDGRWSRDSSWVTCGERGVR